MNKDEDGARHALAAALGVEGVTYPDTYQPTRRRGRPTVSEAERHRTLALSLPPDVAAMLRDDANVNETSASAYVANLIRRAHDAVRTRDPRAFFGSLILVLNESGVETVFIGHKKTTSLADLIMQFPIASVQVNRDLGMLWMDNVAESRADQEQPRVFFQWVKVWDGSRYLNHFWRPIDITYWTEENVVNMIQTGAGDVIPDVF